ncbi:glycerate kinase [Marivirga lumbricoides]|uniref:Glycerate kinase n=1 Tax=Marivirga lumbricoides TaxID=1046115 RepID=A0ABQ1MQF6_9BACT|nr:glycerate kinase [Marivirga lumbricoides]
MKIIIAPDKYKGSLSAEEVANIIGGVIKQYVPDAGVIKFPMADGGEGTSAILGKHFGAEKLNVAVHGPLMRMRMASYYYASKKKEAYIEMAEASGLQLLSAAERNGLIANTYGTGELIKDAIKRGASHIILCIGGSATNDAGTAMANALEYIFQDVEGKAFIPNGETLSQIATIIPPEINYFNRVKVTVLTDVRNPLYGYEGAAYVYGPQKGLSDEECEIVDRGFRHLAKLIKSDFGFSIDEQSGAGAAGGLGGGATFFLNAQLKEGANYISKLLEIEKHVASADWVISGEGKLDSQSLEGKVVTEMYRLAQNFSKPLLLLVGKNDLGDLLKKQFLKTRIFSLTDVAGSEAEAMNQSELMLKQAVKQWVESM